MCAEWCQLLGMLSIMWIERRYVLRAVQSWGEVVATTRELLNVGLPVAVHFALEYLAFASVTGILAQMGEVEVAAHQIAVVINRLAYLPCLAIGEVACILVSSALGAKQMNDAELGMRAARATAVGYMTVCRPALGVGRAAVGGAVHQRSGHRRAGCRSFDGGGAVRCTRRHQHCVAGRAARRARCALECGRGHRRAVDHGAHGHMGPRARSRLGRVGRLVQLRRGNSHLRHHLRLAMALWQLAAGLCRKR